MVRSLFDSSYGLWRISCLNSAGAGNVELGNHGHGIGAGQDVLLGLIDAIPNGNCDTD